MENELFVGIAIGVMSVIVVLLVAFIFAGRDPDQEAKDSWKRKY